MRSSVREGEIDAAMHGNKLRLRGQQHLRNTYGCRRARRALENGCNPNSSYIVLLWSLLLHMLFVHIFKICFCCFYVAAAASAAAAAVDDDVGVVIVVVVVVVVDDGDDDGVDC